VSVSEEITLLLTVQEKDQQGVDLSLKVERLEKQKIQVQRRLDEERAAVDRVRQQLQQLEHNSRLKNLEVDDLDMQIREYQKRLNQGIISFKEMEALRTKILNQRERISEMEDEALALMDEIEVTKTRLAEEEKALGEREKEFTARSQEIASRIAQLREEIASCMEERAEVAARIPAHLLTRYENLHTKFNDPVVTILGGTCSGCKLKVSGNAIERARNGAEIVTCENCSRILYIH